MLAAAAFVPIPPLLVPEIAGGSHLLDEPLRDACRRAVRRLIAAGLDELVVVGPGDRDGPVQGSWDWRGFGVELPHPAPATKLPLGPAIGSWLLDEYAGPTPPRQLYAVTPTSPPEACAALGRQLVSGDRRIGLLVCGDGSACRTEKAPGYFDPAAQEWDAAAVTALETAGPTALLGLDATIGRRLLAAGRAPWQVLAGAASGGTFTSTVDWADAPYGVMYIAGTWISAGAASAS